LKRPLRLALLAEEILRLAERDFDASAVRGAVRPRSFELGRGYPELTGFKRPLRAAQNLLAILGRGSGEDDKQGC
jgi:hypothetical protein